MTTSRNTQISLLLFYCWRVLWPLSQSLRRFITLFYYRLMIFCHRCTSLLYHAVCGVGWNCWADWSQQKWYESLKHYTPIDVYAYTFFVEIGNVELKTHPYSTLIHRVSVHDDYYFSSACIIILLAGRRQWMTTTISLNSVVWREERFFDALPSPPQCRFCWRVRSIRILRGSSKAPISPLMHRDSSMIEIELFRQTCITILIVYVFWLLPFSSSVFVPFFLFFLNLFFFFYDFHRSYQLMYTRAHMYLMTASVFSLVLQIDFQTAGAY